jgi:hypothetical protein
LPSGGWLDSRTRADDQAAPRLRRWRRRPSLILMNLRHTFLAIVAGVLALSSGCTASATPAQIIFLRHAEKPAEGPELTARGWERAKALAPLFTSDPRALEHGPAVAIFAMKPGSARAVQTMEATARALKIRTDHHYFRDEIDGLVNAIRKSKAGEGKTIIVCWEHKVIPEMLKAFGWKEGPKKWPDDVYDRLWILDFENGKPVRFRDLPQKLLPGDSAK